MFLTRTFTAALLASLVSGGAYAAVPENKAEQTLTITATVPAVQPTLQFDDSKTVNMAHDVVSGGFTTAERTFTVKGNSSISMYLQRQEQLTHQTDKNNKIDLKVSAKVGDGLPEPLKAKSENQGRGLVVLNPTTNFDATQVVRGTLSIATEAKADKLRAGEYAGAVTVIVEVNDEDNKVE